LGDETANQGMIKRFDFYWQKNARSRYLSFACMLADALPKKLGSYEWIRWQVPLLSLSSAISVATVLGDLNSAVAFRHERQTLIERIDFDIRKAKEPWRWRYLAKAAEELVHKQIKENLSDFSSKEWVLDSHISCVQVIEDFFTVTNGYENFDEGIQWFGRAFMERVQVPTMEDLRLLCSACYSASAIIDVANDVPIEGLQRLLYTGAVIYSQSQEYLDEWCAFAIRERQAIQRGETNFNLKLGQRLFLKVLSDFRMLDSNGSVSLSVLNAWGQFGSTLLDEIARRTKTRYLERHASPGSP